MSSSFGPGKKKKLDSLIYVNKLINKIMRKTDNKWTAKVKEWQPKNYNRQMRQRTRWRDEIRAFAGSEEKAIRTAVIYKRETQKKIQLKSM